MYITFGEIKPNLNLIPPCTYASRKIIDFVNGLCWIVLPMFDVLPFLFWKKLSHDVCIWWINSAYLVDWFGKPCTGLIYVLYLKTKKVSRTGIKPLFLIPSELRQVSIFTGDPFLETLVKVHHEAFPIVTH